MTGHHCQLLEEGEENPDIAPPIVSRWTSSLKGEVNEEHPIASQKQVLN